jgi:predicted NAD/FAD-binding protein
LVTAHLLAQGHDVTLFERERHAGGHAWTVDVDVPEGGTLPVDVGFMVFNERTYPRLTKLLPELGVRTRTSHMSFSVSDGEEFEFAGHSPAAMFANRAHLVDRDFLRMMREYVRFNREARALMLSEEDPSLRAWLEEREFSSHFIERLLVPQAAAVWSADPDQMWSFPARFLVQFFDNHGMLRLLGRPAWRTLVGGSRTYVEAICARLGEGRVRLGEQVRSVRRDGEGIEVLSGAAGERFDAVVLACHADDALALLADPTPSEREILGAFGYQRSELVLHSDERLLPRRRSARASWNYHLVDPAPGAPTLTYDLKRLQGLRTARPVLASLNVTDRVDPEKVDGVFQLSHPVYTPEAVAAQRRHAEIGGVGGVHFAGAYWGWGFHEDGADSAHRVAGEIELSGLAEAALA